MQDNLSGWDRAYMDCMGAMGLAGGLAGAVGGGYAAGPLGVELGAIAGLLGGALAGKQYCPGWADKNQWDYYNPPLPPNNPPPPDPPQGMNDFPPSPADPLVLDLAGNGIDLTSLSGSSAYFDF